MRDLRPILLVEDNPKDAELTLDALARCQLLNQVTHVRDGVEALQYLRGERDGFDLPLDLSGGTPFQQEVWQALLAIGRGATRSYGELSQHLGRPRAVRAVGAAVGRNPLSVVVPCHRVLGADGSLTGYAGGLGRKVALLTLENALASAQASLLSHSHDKEKAKGAP